MLPAPYTQATLTWTQGFVSNWADSSEAAISKNIFEVSLYVTGAENRNIFGFLGHGRKETKDDNLIDGALRKNVFSENICRSRQLE